MKWLMILLLLCAVVLNMNAQTDSVTIVFTGYGKGAKYRLLYQAKILLAVKDKNQFRYEVTIPVDTTLSTDSHISSLMLLRRGKFKLGFKDADLYVKYKPGFKYFVIEENPRLKNKIAVDYIWLAKYPKKRFEM